MKKNAVLFLILIALIGVTYIFQEKRVEREYTEELKKNRLINFELTHLKLPHVEAEKRNGQWWEGNRLLSHNTFKQIEKKLSEIKKIKEIKGEWKSFSSNPFNFEINHSQWSIGDLSLDKQGFYIAHEKKIFLAVIEGESTQLTRNEEEIASIKLDELKSALSRTREELKETQLFRFYPELPMAKILLNVEGNLPFELNFEKNETLPPPIKGIAVHKDLRSKFNSLLTQVTVREEIPYSEDLKFKKMGELTFMGNDKSVKWELWLKSDKSADAIVIDSNLKKAFLMVGGTLKIFFVRLQDYWDKKVVPQESFTSFTRLPATFIQGDKNARVVILNKEPLDFEAPGFKVEREKMEQLMQFLFNLGPKDQGERVSLLSKSEKQQLLSEEHLRIEVMGQELILWRKQQELIVANVTQGFKVHFALMDENFRGTFEDVLK